MVAVTAVCYLANRVDEVYETNMKTISVYLSSLSLVAPGMESWKQALPVLQGIEAYVKQPLPKIAPSILPANERRRTTPLIKLALHVAEQCIGTDLTLASQYATVFASSDGDHNINDKMCTAVNLAEHPVSPTNFHNSVHNAPAGYWAIAAQAQFNSNSLSACEETFTAGFIEAATFTVLEETPVLLVAYDMQAAQPFDSARHLDDSFGVGMCLTAKPISSSVAKLELTLSNSKEVTTCADLTLETLRKGNPAARALPLLQALACEQNTTVVLPNVQSSALSIKVSKL